MIVLRIAAWLLAFALAGALIVLASYIGTRPANAQDRGAWFKSLKTPYGGSCCDLSDCRETEAEWKRGDDGAWGWYASVESYRGRITIQIPADRVLEQPKSIDGEAYVCHTPGSAGGQTYSPYTPGATEVPASDPHIYCFIPPLTSY